MKRIILPFIILCLLMGYHVYCEKNLCDFCDEAVSTLEICAEQIKEEAYPLAQNTADRLLDILDERYVFFSSYAGNTDIAVIYSDIVTLKRYLGDRDTDHCISAIRACQNNIDKLKSTNRTDLGNLL